MSTRVVTGKVRLSFPRLFVPEENLNGNLVYSTKILIPKSDKDTLRKLKAAEKTALTEGMQKHFPGQDRVRNLKPSIIRDGDESDLRKYPEDAGHWTLNVSSNEKFKPGVVDKNVQPILDQSEIYSGVYARVSLTAFFYKNLAAGVSFGLNNVQKLADGESLTGGATAGDDFDVFEDDAAEDEDDFI